MKPKLDLDPDFAAPPPRRYALVRTFGLLSIFALMPSFALLSSRATLSAPQVLAQGAGNVPTLARLMIRQPVPGAPVELLKPQPLDHFVVIASPAIDPQMVRRAPVGIDDGMVIRPRDDQAAPRRLVGPNGAAPPRYFEAPGGTTVPDGQIAPQVPVYPTVPARPR
jgi:hypothetical protein